jgi:DNA-binding MarR family transcriptional regulator
VKDDDELGPPVRDRLTYVFKRLHLDLHELHDQLLAPFGISAGQLAVLMLIDAREPESQQQIARRLGVDRTSMVSLIDALEGAGLVVREPDPDDRRRNVVALTEAGTETLRRATKASDKAEQRLLSALTPTEGRQLRSLLGRIIATPGSPK